ncbi:hypothetical protein Lser_V15G42301 [Lactuca serriola]
MIQTMDVHEDQDLDGLPNVPSSRYRNSDVHDANIEDGNPANWIGKYFDDQDYEEDSEEDYIEETPAWNVISSDESNQEEEPQEQQPSKKRKFATPQKRKWIKEDDGIERKWAECNYCLHLLVADPNRNGTTSINKHFNGCKLNPDNIPKQGTTI